MLFDHQNLGKDISYVEISVILVKKMIRNIIFGNGGTLSFSYNSDKGTPPLDVLVRCLSLFWYLRNLIRSGVRRYSILSPLWKTVYKFDSEGRDPSKW